MRAIIAVTLLAALCSCGEEPRKETSSEAPRRAPIVKDGVHAVGRDAVIVVRRAMGRWRSPAGVLPGSRNQWLLLDIAGTKDARLEIRTSDFGHESVTAFATGHVVITTPGIDVSLPDAKGVLGDFRRASATFPTTSTMILRSAKGRELTLTYDGI